MVKIAFPWNKAFAIHAKAIASSSPYLQRRVEQVDPRGTLDFVTIAPNIYWCINFNQYVNWIYKGHFATDTSQHAPQRPTPQQALFGVRPNHPASTFTADNQVFDYRKALYLLGIELQDTPFQDAVLDVFDAKCQGVKNVPRASVVNDIYQDTSAGCKARLLLVKVFVSKATAHDLACAEYHPHFLQDYAISMTRERFVLPTLELGKCSYHTHAANETCGGRKRKRK